MAKVPTVTGEIDSSDIGFALMHEHVLVINAYMLNAFPNWFDREAFMKDAVAEAKAAKDAGVKTVVEVTPINLGRDINIMREVAEQSGIQIIPATGFYHTEELIVRIWEVDKLVETLLPEIRDGIQGTNIKAGIIKCATDHEGLTPTNKKLLQMTARLHRATGVPITTHTLASAKTGDLQQEVFGEEGVDLSRVVIGHCDETEDVDYLTGLMKRGSFIGMDHFGIERARSSQQRADMIARLCKMGYGSQIVLSHDAQCGADIFPNGLRKSGILERMPKWSWSFIPNEVVPMLKQAGVSDADIQAMTVDNPRRVFERNTGPY